MLNLLLELQEERKLSYLFIAHDLAVVKHISDRVAVMYLGKIVEMSDAETIYQSPKHAYTKALLDAIPEPDPSMLIGIAGVANTGDDANWCGHHFSQANWYAFGRLDRKSTRLNSSHRT